MKNFSLSLFFDTILGFACLFVTSFIFLRIFRPPLIILTIGSFIFSAAITSIISLIKTKKQKYSISLKNSTEETKRLASYLSKLNDTEINLLITKILLNQNIKVVKSSGRYILLENACIIALFLPNAVSLNEITFYIRNCPYNSNEYYIFSNEFLPQETSDNICLVPTNLFYQTIKELSSETLLLIKPQKIKKPNLFKLLFRRAAAPRLIFYGIFLLLTSYFVFFPIYYIIFGSFFTIYGFISLFLAKDTAKTNKYDNLFNKNKKDG